MVDDTAALFRQLTIEGADFFSYSDSGNVVLEISICHPHLVRKPVVAAAFNNNDGLCPESLGFLKHATPKVSGESCEMLTLRWRARFRPGTRSVVAFQKARQSYRCHHVVYGPRQLDESGGVARA